MPYPSQTLDQDPMPHPMQAQALDAALHGGAPCSSVADLTLYPKPRPRVAQALDAALRRGAPCGSVMDLKPRP